MFFTNTYTDTEPLYVFYWYQDRAAVCFLPIPVPIPSHCMFSTDTYTEPLYVFYLYLYRYRAAVYFLLIPIPILLPSRCMWSSLHDTRASVGTAGTEMGQHLSLGGEPLAHPAGGRWCPQAVHRKTQAVRWLAEQVGENCGWVSEELCRRRGARYCSVHTRSQGASRRIIIVSCL